MGKNDNVTRRKKAIKIAFAALMVLTVVGYIVFFATDMLFFAKAPSDKDYYFMLYLGILLLVLYVLFAEGNLFFDAMYFASEKEKKTAFKTVCHIIGVCLSAMLITMLSLIRWIPRETFNALTPVIASGFIAVRTANFIAHLVSDKDGENNIDINNSKENIQ